MPTSGTHKKPLQNLLGILTIALSLLGLTTSSPLAIAQSNTTTPTTINVSESAKMTNAKRLGVNLGTQNYWDSGMIMRNLAFNNPGFEGQSWQTILHCVTVTATSCTDDNLYTYWPANFLAGATASFIVGPAAGTSATVTSSSLPVPGTSAVTIQMSGLSVAPSIGDYVVVRTDGPGGAGAGWWLYGSGATYSSETTDISPNSPGKQALVINASGPGQTAVLANFDDGFAGRTFLKLNGTYTLNFRAKSTGGSNVLNLTLKRNVSAPPASIFFDQNVTLTNQWQDYSFTYNLSEGTPQPGAQLALTFTLSGGSMLLDDVAFTEAAGPNNPTVYRDAVVSALQALHPGTLRYMDTGENWGSSIDNLLAPDFARERAGYSNFVTQQNAIAMGLHDFLVLCQTVGADPWFTMPTGMTTQEMSNLMDYLGGSTSTVYGAKRAALGQTAPWTTVFGQIHLEFGNEVWNTANPGANIADAASYGKRAAVIFGTAKASPSYAAKSFDFVLDGFEVLPGWTQTALQNSANYDTVDCATYNFANFNDASSIENIYGPMFAEPEWYNSTSSGYTAQQAAVAASSGPTPAHLAVYETNMGTNQGSVAQAQVEAVVPSVGGGIAVAANMLLAQRDLGVTVQNMFALEGYQVPFFGGGSTGATTSPIWGVVVDMGGPTNLRRPMFLSEQLANSAILPTLLATSQTGSNPTWSETSTLNDKFTVPAAHYIQSIAYTDGTTLNVILFNLSRTSALPVNFAGLNAPIGTATISTLTAPSIEATNENGNNVEITSSSQSLEAGSVLTLPPYSMTVVSVPAPVIPILITGVTDTCGRTSLSPGDSTTCSATVTGQGDYNNSVVWSAAAGSITSSGVYTAPAALPASGKDVITATAAGNSAKSASFTIAIAPNTITGVTASCAASTINQGATTQCTAAVAGTGGFSNAYTWSAPAGSFNASGIFTAPATGNSVVVTATSTQDPTKSASVTLKLNTTLVMSTPTATTTPTTATITWSTNLGAFQDLYYTAMPNGQSITYPGSGYVGTNHSITLTGLTPSTTYSVYAFSFEESETVGQTITFTTPSSTSTITGVSVTCAAQSLALGASDGCSATVQGTGSYSSAVTWSTFLGTISSTGVLTAPLSTTAAAVTLTATSVQDPTKSGTYTVSFIQTPTITGVSLSCAPASVLAGSTTTCTPAVTGTNSFSKAVTFTASAGTITSAGVLTAPTTGSSIAVTATSVQDPTKSATATVTITSAITAVSVACPATTLVGGSSTTCSSTVTGTGSYSSGVTWSASAGSITSAGRFTAPSTGSSVTITATSTQDPTKSGSATLTLTPQLTMSGVTTSVTSTTATINWTTNLPAFQDLYYTAPGAQPLTYPGSGYVGTNHSITITGLTPSTTYSVYAFSFEESQDAGVNLTVTTAAAAPSVSQVKISCPGGTLAAGGSGSCTSTVTGTGNYSQAVTWTASAGSITPAGVLTAPATGTSVTVKATSVQDSTKSATATIPLTQVATISSLKVSCPVSTLPFGKSVTCTATAVGTGNPSSAVTWSASAGSVTPAGVVTAPLSGTSITVTATSTQDPGKSGSVTIALVQNLAIISPSFSATPTTIVLSWSLTQSAYSGAGYAGSSTPYVAGPFQTTTSTHPTVTLTGLTPGTTYTTTIYSSNQWGSVSQQLTVTTPLQ
jgi:alpha-L-arabinofuranosidase